MDRAEDRKIGSLEVNESMASELPHLRASDPSLCVKCGNCKSLCPTHIEFMNEGMSARGRVALLKKFFSGEIESSDNLDERIFSCLLCGSCNSLCPLGISITDVVYEGRRRLADRKKYWLFRSLMKYAFMDPARTLRIFQFFGNSGLLPFLRRLRPFRAMEDLGIRVPGTRLRDGASLFKVPKPRGRIAIFAGCTVDFLFPAMGLSLIYTLNAMDYDVVLPKGEACCGAPLLASGLRKEVEALAEKNLHAFKKLQAEAVISLCPTCTHFIRYEYPKIIGDGIGNVMDISRFLDDVPLDTMLMQPAESPGTVTYHDPCHSINYLGIKDEPRKILKTLGFGITEPAERGCCGLGGTVRLLHEDVSAAILETRVKALKGTDALGMPDMIVTSCPNCVLQLGSRIKERPVKHIIEIIAANMKRRA